MTKVLQGLLCLFLIPLFLISCTEKEKEEYYKPPEGLVPIYQQLKAEGNFTHFLECIDKTSYKNVLDRTGYFTCFAPNDAAFEKFFSSRGSSEIDNELASKIVSYSLVYNGFTRAQLADFQSNTGWIPASAFKRRTANYSGVYDGKNAEGQNIKVVNGNWNGLNYILEDNNNKYIPYFIDEYFATKNLTAADYNYFYPDVPYTGFNVVDAQVVSPDIRAENGVIHEINNVILPLPSLDEYLSAKPEYSKFKELLEKNTVTYFFNESATAKNSARTGSTDPVYVKGYSPLLAFAPVNESFLRVSINDGQSDGYSMIVPTNEALEKYINDVLLEHYPEKNFDYLPNNVKMDFFNAHLWQTSLWPGSFGTANFLGEKATVDPNTDVVDAKILSNGIFYGSKKVHESDAFHSVFGKAYLNPSYSLMTKFLQRELRAALSSPFINYTVFLLSDDVLKAAGYNFDDSQNAWTFNGSTNFAVDRLTRLINGHIAITRNNELNNLGGNGIVETYGGEFIRFDNYQVYAGGNVEGTNQKITVNSEKIPAKNGIVYYLDKPLLMPDSAVSAHIRKYSQFSKFNEYLRSSTLYNGSTGEIDGTAIGTFYTFFIPSNEAMNAAIADGVLPANPKTTDLSEKIRIANFLQYHILNRVSIIPNGKETGRFESIYKDANGDATALEVKYEGGLLKVEDQTGRTAVVEEFNSNILATRAVLHQINTYLKYQ